MTFTIQRLPDEPIMLVAHESKQFLDDMPETMRAFQASLDAEPEPVFVVMDIRGLGLGLDDLPKAASVAAMKPEALLHHPMIRESLLVSNDGLVRLAAQGMRTATFGNVRMHVFGTPEQALDYCREKIAQEAAEPGQNR